MFTKKILITGGAGFIGSNFIEHFIKKHESYQFINLDKLTYAGHLENLSEVENAQNYKFIEGDICDRDLIEKLFSEYGITDIIHFAAESHVDNSIEGPEDFIKTNINGTFTLIDVARKSWMHAPFKYKEQYRNSRFHHVSTDEVYGSLGETGLFTEKTPYAPNSPYSASKASSDMIVRSYFHTYGLNVTTSNCSNNYGPKQHNEKLIPVIIEKIISGKKIPIYGDGLNVRDWLYVADHCKAIDLVFHEGRAGEVYNIGGECERTNMQIVNLLCDRLNKIKPKEGHDYKNQISFVSDRPGHDRRYAIDISKITNELNWKPEETFESGIEKTINWYLEAQAQV